jgi:hypothetical protein
LPLLLSLPLLFGCHPSPKAEDLLLSLPLSLLLLLSLPLLFSCHPSPKAEDPLLPLPLPFGCHPSPKAEDLLLSLLLLLSLPLLFSCHPSPKAEDLLSPLPFLLSSRRGSAVVLAVISLLGRSPGALPDTPKPFVLPLQSKPWPTRTTAERYYLSSPRPS